MLKEYSITCFYIKNSPVCLLYAFMKSALYLYSTKSSIQKCTITRRNGQMHMECLTLSVVVNYLISYGKDRGPHGELVSNIELCCICR